MTVLIPDMTEQGTPVVWTPEGEVGGMQKKYMDKVSKDYEGMKILVNKPPKWNEGSYTILFN